MPMPRFRFPRSQRLKRRRDFQRVFARKASIADGNLVIYACPNDLGYSRLGLVVSKRLGGAVVRNRIKRRIREAYRLSRHELPKGIDAVCIPRGGNPRSVELLDRSLRRLLAKLSRRLESEEEAHDSQAGPRRPTPGA